MVAHTGGVLVSLFRAVLLCTVCGVVGDGGVGQRFALEGATATQVAELHDYILHAIGVIDSRDGPRHAASNS